MRDNSHPPEQATIRFGEEPPFARLPSLDNIFLKRSSRFAQLANLRKPKEFFVFLSSLAKAQHHAFLETPHLPQLSATYLAYCRENLIPPAAPEMVKIGDINWIPIFRAILANLENAPTPQLASAVERAQVLDRQVLDAWATAMLRGIFKPVEPSIAPLIYAALQVCWAKIVYHINVQELVRLSTPGNCPACGSSPVAGLIISEGQLRGTRYLCCNLCPTQWYMVRLKCSYCDSTEGIAYYVLEGRDQSLKAETCPTCKTYLKLMYLEQNPELDPVADDVGSYALDLMLAEQGWQRRTPVPFLFISSDQ